METIMVFAQAINLVEVIDAILENNILMETVEILIKTMKAEVLDKPFKLEDLKLDIIVNVSNHQLFKTVIELDNSLVALNLSVEEQEQLFSI
jgi:hypothetical protein